MSSAFLRLASAAALAVLVVSGVGCAASAPPYAACGDGIGCDGASCIDLLYTLDDGSEGGGPFCSARCESDAACPEAGVCVTVDVAPPLRFVCVATCEAPTDCFSGTRCTELVGPADVMHVCLP